MLCPKCLAPMPDTRACNEVGTDMCEDCQHEFDTLDLEDQLTVALSLADGGRNG